MAAAQAQSQRSPNPAPLQHGVGDGYLIWLTTARWNERGWPGHAACYAVAARHQAPPRATGASAAATAQPSTGISPHPVMPSTATLAQSPTSTPPIPRQYALWTVDAHHVQFPPNLTWTKKDDCMKGLVILGEILRPWEALINSSVYVNFTWTLDQGGQTQISGVKVASEERLRTFNDELLAHKIAWHEARKKKPIAGKLMWVTTPFWQYFNGRAPHPSSASEGYAVSFDTSPPMAGKPPIRIDALAIKFPAHITQLAESAYLREVQDQGRLAVEVKQLVRDGLPLEITGNPNTGEISSVVVEQGQLANFQPQGVQQHLRNVEAWYTQEYGSRQ